MDLAMDVYIPEDYVRSRYNPNMSMQKQADHAHARVSNFNDIKATDEKKCQLQSNKIVMIFASNGHSRSNSFKEDILFNYFNT